ncbi:MAG: acetylglutamate kinase, partial [Chloroflexi bacterium]|nr:acetylglutamate kinase [Chloroflexota bacterium]
MEMHKPTVIKIGGSTLGNHDTTLDDIVELQRQGKPLVVVHGGGKVITDWLAKQGIASRFVRGERVTDQPSLEVVVAVLAGLVNKEIVADINGRGGRAVGLSGVDGALLEGKIRNEEMGYVGEVTKVNVAVLETLLGAGFVPVVAPVGFNSLQQLAAAPRTLNFNADVAAGEIAAAIGAERLVFLTEVAGILDQTGKLVPKLSSSEAEAMVAAGVASGGMIPKIRACLRAVSGAASTCFIDGREPHALIHEINGKGGGTYI